MHAHLWPSGAKFLTEYKRDGNLLWPTLLDNVTSSMRIAWEEPFGPVLPIMRVDGVEQAIEHCNQNNVALQGCVFTKDINKAIMISDAMETGTVQASEGGTSVEQASACHHVRLLSYMDTMLHFRKISSYGPIVSPSRALLLLSFRSTQPRHEGRITSPSKASVIVG
jgi:hypothetical protein